MLGFASRAPTQALSPVLGFASRAHLFKRSLPQPRASRTPPTTAYTPRPTSTPKHSTYRRVSSGRSLPHRIHFVTSLAIRSQRPPAPRDLPLTVAPLLPVLCHHVGERRLAALL
ncbi:hypothetical protein I4F81_002112 [Pyropia yezoensis]|uniref:Uncharacterized protein n=1 Tax=Pyropia yezoensis TaxID=2788 RepID=A0ACC3BNM8_PYRYE|nr:hypothetical protein I4F81_002112 [Neopyropia yezoensis]